MIKHFKTSTSKDYISLARELGMLEGKARTDNMLIEWWKQHGADTCVVYEEKLDGEKSWKVTNYNTALSEGEIVTVYTTDDMIPNDLNKNDVVSNNLKIYHVETQEDYDDLMVELEKQGYKWISGNKPTSEECWDERKRETIIYLNEGGYRAITRGFIRNAKTHYPNINIIKHKAGDALESENNKADKLSEYADNLRELKEDLVNHPRHYNQYSQEVIDTIEEVTANMPVSVAYHVGNAIKYLFRAPFKGKMKQDIEKAVWYLERALTKL